MYFNRNAHAAKEKGGYWICRIVRLQQSRDFYAKTRERRCEQVRAKYQNDALHRLTKNFKRLQRGSVHRIQQLEKERA